MYLEASLFGFLGTALTLAALITKYPYKTGFAKGSANFIFGVGQVMFIGLALLALIFDTHGLYYGGGVWAIMATAIVVESIRKFIKA